MKERFKEIDNDFDKLLKSVERKIAKEYTEVLKKIKFDIAELYTKYSEDGKLTLIEMQKYERIKKMDADIQKALDELFVSNRTIIANGLRDTYNTTFESTKLIIEDETKKTLRAISKPVEVTKTINQEMVGLKWGERLGKQRSDVIYAVQKSVKEGLSKGDTYKTMALRINAELGKDAPRAITIARTESARVNSQAQKDVLDVARKQGIKMVKTWNPVRDERGRDSHSKMDGQTVPYDDDFVSPKGNRAKMPLMFGVASEDVNCRCFVSFEIAD